MIVTFVLFVILMITIALLTVWPEPGYRGGAARPNFKKMPESKFEALIRGYLEALLGFKFPLVHPPWLGGLELDGYNEELCLAFEAQGPLHYKYVPRLDSTREKFIARVKNDQKKVVECKKQGVYLMVIDYMVPKYLVGDYIKSRLHDGVATGQLKHPAIVARFSEKPFKYVEPSKLVPQISSAQI